jgi:hypothetical protein
VVCVIWVFFYNESVLILEFLDMCCGVILSSVSSNTYFAFSLVIDGTGEGSTDDVDGGVDGKGIDDGGDVRSLGHGSTGGANNADDAEETTTKKGSDNDGRGRGSGGVLLDVFCFGIIPHLF